MPLQTEPLSVLDILGSIPDSVLTIDRDKRSIKGYGNVKHLAAGYLAGWEKAGYPVVK